MRTKQTYRVHVWDKVNRQKPLYRVNFGVFADMVCNGRYERQIKKIRSFTYDSKEYKSAKLDLLSAVTIDKHSPIFKFDIDSKDNPGVSLEEMKNKCKNLSSLFMCYASPSGRGIHIFEKTDNLLSESDYKLYAQARRLELEKLTGLVFDGAMDKPGQKIFISFDSDLFYNPDSKPIETDKLAITDYCEIKPAKKKSKQSHAKTKNVDSTAIKTPKNSDKALKTVKECYRQLANAKKQITPAGEMGHKTWQVIAHALINELRAGDALTYFHKFSKLDSRYDYDQAQDFFSSIKACNIANQGKNKRRATVRSIVFWTEKALDKKIRPAELADYMPGGTMEVKRRRARILKSFHRAGGLDYINPDFTSGKRLSDIYGVSIPTIKKDLQELEGALLLSRTVINPGSFDRTKKVKVTGEALSLLYKFAESQVCEVSPILTKNVDSSKLTQGLTIYNSYPVRDIPIKEKELITEKGELNSSLPPSKNYTAPSVSSPKVQMASSKKLKKETEIMQNDVMNPIESDKQILSVLTAPIPEPVRTKAEHAKAMKRAMEIKSIWGAIRPGVSIDSKSAKLLLKIVLNDSTFTAICSQLPNIKPGKSLYFFLADQDYLSSGAKKVEGASPIAVENVAETVYLIPGNVYPLDVPENLPFVLQNHFDRGNKWVMIVKNGELFDYQRKTKILPPKRVTKKALPRRK